MIPAIQFALGQIDLPAPPIPGGEAVTEWWRVIALIAVTVLTTGILALIFRPGIPVPALETESDQPALHTVPTNIAPLRRSSDLATGSVIPFPGTRPAESALQSNAAAMAATERLRRLTQRTDADPQGDELPVAQPPDVQLGRQVTEPQTGPVEEEIGDTDLEVTKVATTDLFDMDADTMAGNEEMMAGTPDSWDLLGDLAERLPSQADSLPAVPPAFIPTEDLDLLGDIANRSPSEMDLVVSEIPVETPILTGTPPSEDDVDRMLEQPPFGKIVQFVPRPAQPAAPDMDPAYELLNEFQDQNESTITQFPVDLMTRELITATVQELLFCANVGEFIHGFALYTDKFLFTFMDQSGLNEDEFRERFSSVPPKDPTDWTRIESIREFRRLDDGRVAATIQYINRGRIDGRERYVFKHDAQTQRWMIDDITSAG